MADKTSYDLTITPAAKRDLRKLRGNLIVLKSIDQTIQGLSKNPRPSGIEKLSNGSFRVRDGSYRILFDIDDKNLIVEIKRVRDRKEVYRH